MENHFNPDEILGMSDEQIENIISTTYFTEGEWRDLSDLEKMRNRRMFENYVTNPELANIIPKPEFMNKLKKDPEQKTNEHSVCNGSEKIKKIKRQNDQQGSKFKISKLGAKRSEKEVRKNPERASKATISSYYEDDTPDEDRYIFCDICEKDVLDYCATCGMLVTVSDIRVPMREPERARKTVPSMFEIRPSTVHGLGVFAKRRVPQGIQVGPYEGTVTRVPSTNGYSWKLKAGKLVDAGDESVSNWMRFVNCAKHVSLQNLMAFQYRGGLYYRTVRPIVDGEELLVYYGNEFARELGIDPKRYFDPEVEEMLRDYYECEKCHIGLSSVKYRDDHQKYCRFGRNEMHLGETFKCDFCLILCSVKEDRDRHQKRCRQNPAVKSKGEKCLNEKLTQLFGCHQCEYKTKIKRSLKTHFLVHNKENAKTFQCNICLYKTIYQNNLKSHLRTHKPSGRFICTFCNKSFNQKIHLAQHYLSKHKNKSAQFNKIINIKIHECQICSYETCYATHFKHHLLIHETSPDKFQFNCGICGYRCIQKSRLKMHLRLHADMKPYVCIQCSNRFNHKRGLDEHIIKHHSDHEGLMKTVTHKIHVCQNCIYKTVNSNNLKRHLKSCKNEKINQT